MRLLPSGFWPLRSAGLSAARFCVFGAVGAGLAACAAQQSPRYAGVHDQAPRPHPVTERQWKVEIEDDGKPAQQPPVRRMRPEEDDPSQPWSPNYGKAPGSMIKPATPQPRSPWPQPIEAQDLRPTPSEAPGRKLSSMEADAVVLRAIHNHEMRKP